MARASVKEVGVKVSETNISTTSAWRHRKSNREAEAKSIKENFTPSQISALHWDEKVITLMRKGKTHGSKLPFFSLTLQRLDFSDMPQCSQDLAAENLEWALDILEKNTRRC